MKPKYKIGDSVKSSSVLQILMVITIIENEDCSNFKYKCAWIADELAYSDYFAEHDLMPLTASRYY